MTEKKKILIIEDDLMSLKLQKELLEYAGYEVLFAGKPESGISMAKESLPDLIIMDYQLPEMTGEQAVKILKADEKTKNIPVIFVTASVMDADKERLGSYQVITKPINTRTFVSEIEEILNRR